jgi:2-oxoglutarate ferredoxin oxidoreductase subunit alpha
MSTLSVEPQRSGSPAPADVVNEFSIQVATANGSGSQTANNVLMRSIMQMGVPVSGKNMFPSNIAGLPTWFTVRASRRGFIGRKKEVDVLVAMNPETAREDVLGVPSGAAVVYDEPLRLNQLRHDLFFYPVPFDQLVGPVCPEARLRKLVKNMIYDGVLAFLLHIDLDEMRRALFKQFGPRKVKAAEMNQGALRAGFDWAAANLVKRDPFRIERMDATRGKIIIDGNSATALGAVFAGVTVVTWYPITPSSSLAEALINYLRRFRQHPQSAKATYAVLQAEDELASVGMALGAGWAGARSMTCTSGPGISLMAEFVGLGYYAEVPTVIVDVQRVGPSTGLPTRTQQGDLLSTAFLSHGDTKHPMLIPASPAECFSMMQDAFNLAERFQTPVFVMTDLDLGMNNWMSDPFPYPSQPLDRGKVLSAADLDRLGGFARYQDVDGDAIGWRTLPATPHPHAAYFCRGSGHNESAQYSERDDDYRRNVDRLARKFESMRAVAPPPVIHHHPDAQIAFIACGTSDYAVRESQVQLQEDYHLPTSYLRIRSFPFAPSIATFIRAHQRVYVIDQNRDAQLLSLLKLDLPPTLAARLRSIRHYGGLPIDARSITDDLLTQEETLP